MRTKLEKLQLQPGDIVVVTLKRETGKCGREKIIDEMRKVLMPGQRMIITTEEIRVQKLAELLTPSDFRDLTKAMRPKLLMGMPADPAD